MKKSAPITRDSPIPSIIPGAKYIPPTQILIPQNKLTTLAIDKQLSTKFMREYFPNSKGTRIKL